MKVLLGVLAGDVLPALDGAAPEEEEALGALARVPVLRGRVAGARRAGAGACLGLGRRDPREKKTGPRWERAQREDGMEEEGDMDAAGWKYVGRHVRALAEAETEECGAKGGRGGSGAGS